MQNPQLAKLTSEQANELKLTFTAMDQNGDGSVTKQELKHLLQGLGERVSDEYIDDMIARADVNLDGKIIFDEFLSAAAQDGSNAGGAPRNAGGRSREGVVKAAPQQWNQ